MCCIFYWQLKKFKLRRKQNIEKEKGSVIGCNPNSQHDEGIHEKGVSTIRIDFSVNNVIPLFLVYLLDL